MRPKISRETLCRCSHHQAAPNSLLGFKYCPVIGSMWSHNLPKFFIK
jgi:hypothetical protein